MRYHPYIHSRKGETMTDSNIEAWFEIDSELVKWDTPDTSVDGIYSGVEIVETQHGPAKLYSFKPRAGESTFWQFFGTTTLNGLMAGIDVGQEVMVTFKGWNEAATPPYKLFTVAVRMAL